MGVSAGYLVRAVAASHISGPGYVQDDDTRKSHVLSFSFIHLVKCVVVMSWWISPALLLGMHRGEGWVVFLSHYHCEAYTRYDNNVSTQCNCTTARSWSSMFCASSTMICTTSNWHKDGALICKLDGFLLHIHDYVTFHFNLFAIRSEMHSSIIGLRNLSQIKILVDLNLYSQQYRNLTYAFTVIQQWLVLRMQWNLRGLAHG